MRKEVLFAIIAGIGAGLFLAFGVWKLTSKISKKVAISPSPIVQNETPTPKPGFTITIASPKNSSVVTDSLLTITGKSEPLSKMVISTSVDDYFVKVDDNGDFSSDITLQPGLNITNLTAFNSLGNEITAKLDLVFSSEFAKYLDDSNKNNSSAFLGTITDINEGNLQIKTANGAIQQLTLASDASFVKIKQPAGTAETIKSTDLAIGDYIITLGFLANGSGVLDTKRVIVTSENNKNESVAIPGKVTEITKKLLSMTKNNNEAMEITLPKSWEGPNVSELETDEQIMVVGTQNDKGFNLRTIFITSSLTEQ